MSRNGIEPNNRNPRYRARHAYPPLPALQLAIERQGMRLRDEVRVADLTPLDQFDVFSLIPNCGVWPLKNIPGLTLASLNHFRTEGIGCAAWIVQDPEGNYDIIFNDQRSPRELRAVLLEEFFHLRLGHEPDKIRIVGSSAFRTYSRTKEEEAWGCATAALVPYTGLDLLVGCGEHIDRIAERYVVTSDIVQQRLEVTRLGELMTSAPHQLPLLVSS